MVNSRAKGNRGEREAIKLLKSWWGGDKWSRRSMGQEGDDIVETPDDFPWSVEVKNVASLRAMHLFYPNKEIKDYWQQTLDQATEKFPLLLAKIERKWYAIHNQIPESYHYKTRIGTNEAIIQTIDNFFVSYDGKVLTYGHKEIKKETHMLGVQKTESKE